VDNDPRPDMQLPLEIHFQNMDASDAVEADIRKRVAKLEHFAENIVSCRVSVEAPHKHHHKGKLYAVHIDLRVPGGEIVASREPGQDHSHEDVYVAVRDAFDAVGRQLQDLTRIRQGQVKHHEPAP
jgi:ribosomal subunit interface protein